MQERKSLSMGGALKSRVLTLLVLGLMIGFSQIPLLQHQSEFNDEPMIQRSGSDPGVTDLPSWRVGDNGFTPERSIPQF